MPVSGIQKTSMEGLGRMSHEEFHSSQKRTVCLVLDNIRSLQNVGSFFRTADAFSLEKILLCGITGTPPNREIDKTALGATESMEWEYFSETEEAVLSLQRNGYRIISLEQTNQSRMLHEFRPGKEEKIAYVFGNEVFGVNDSILELSDLILEIPQSGTKHSLNVSVTAGIVIWDYYLKTSLNLFSNPS